MLPRSEWTHATMIQEIVDDGFINRLQLRAVQLQRDPRWLAGVDVSWLVDLADARRSMERQLSLRHPPDCQGIQTSLPHDLIYVPRQTDPWRKRSRPPRYCFARQYASKRASLASSSFS